MTATCAICGTATEVSATSLPEPAEPPDFDTRPGEPLRQTLRHWIQQCRGCGYAAEDISGAVHGADAVVRSPTFESLRSDEGVPEAARPFLLYAHLLDRLRQPSDAGWSCLHAAWACDDAGEDAAATLCRRQTIELWKKGKLAGESFADDMASEFALVTDVHRRAGEFERATVACAEGLDVEDIPLVIERILRRQMVLIQAGDRSAHSVREVLS